MLCNLCKRHKTKSKYNQSTVWSESPCVCLRRDSVRCHSLSQQHKDAVELEMYRKGCQRSGGIRQAFESQIAIYSDNYNALSFLASQIRNTTHYALRQPH